MCARSALLKPDRAVAGIEQWAGDGQAEAGAAIGTTRSEEGFE